MQSAHNFICATAILAIVHNRLLHLCRIVVWVRSPAREEQCAVLGDINRSSTRSLHEDIHQTSADLDIVPAISTLVLASYQHTQFSADVFVPCVNHPRYVHTASLQLINDECCHLTR